MKSKYYLRMGMDTLDEAVGYWTKSAAVAAYRDVAEELDQYGQVIDGTIHMAPTRYEIAEYPDFALSLGPRGGVRVERT